MKKITFFPKMIATILLGGITIAKASEKNQEAKEFQLKEGEIKIILTAEKGDYFPYNETTEKEPLAFVSPKHAGLDNTIGRKTEYEVTLTVDKNYVVSDNGTVMLIRYNTVTKDHTVCKLVLVVDKATGMAKMELYEVTTLTANKDADNNVVVLQYPGTKLEALVAELCKKLSLIPNLKLAKHFDKKQAIAWLPPAGYGVVATNKTTGLKSLVSRKSDSEEDAATMTLLWNEVTNLLSAPLDGSVLKVTDSDEVNVLEAEPLNS